MKHDDLIRRLCEGSAELSAEVWTALTGKPHEARRHLAIGSVYVAECESPQDGVLWDDWKDCLTTSLSAAWEEARKKYSEIALVRNRHGECSAELWVPGGEIGTRQVALIYGKHEACTLVAAILAAEGER